ncbi:MAG: NAD(P)/FAD-dependent oxidoreductase [Burkholderia sp.]|nr:NAD(P)/FAD-dependent oxidoreductase [Burkholderia sp.]
MMNRRSFLLGATGAGLIAASTGAAYWRWRDITPGVRFPGRDAGHWLRNRQALPAASVTLDTDVVILGSGVAGLTAAWKLKREGHRRVLVIDGPQPYGNTAGGRFGDLAYPTGAHYLPLPSTECFHVREMLHDLGILQRNPAAARPVYDERFLVHKPQERLLIDGAWQEGLVPRHGVPDEHLEQHERFFSQMDMFRLARGSDGRRAFSVPSALSSNDAAFRALDELTFKDWLIRNDFRAPSLHWYLDYCCRDDYGTSYGDVSAWAGLHYFCSRTGEAENADPHAVLTWPDGLQSLTAALDAAADSRRRSGTVASVKCTPQGVQAHCFELVDGRPRSFVVNARKAICAMPLFMAARVVDDIRLLDFDPYRDLASYAPWMVSNFLMEGFPDELPDAPLSWDNVVYGGRGLGYVLSTHQDIRVTPPQRTVFSSYVALAGQAPQQARKWMDTASAGELLDLASSDLRAAYGEQFFRHARHAEITLHAHAMASPQPGFTRNAGLHALQEADGAILFAHADLSGFSLFEEAAWWGYQAALKAMA